jgi:hypothetical protein
MALVLEGGAARQFQLTDFWIGALLVGANTVVLLAALSVGWLRHLAHERELLKIRKKAVKLEWAVGWDTHQFQSTLQTLSDAKVTRSHVMCFHYTSMAAAHTYAKYGIPCFEASFGLDDRAAEGGDPRAKGIVFSLKGPHELTRPAPGPGKEPHHHAGLARMSPFSPSMEACFAVALPRALLEPLPPDPTPGPALALTLALKEQGGSTAAAGPAAAGSGTGSKGEAAPDPPAKKGRWGRTSKTASAALAASQSAVVAPSPPHPTEQGEEDCALFYVPLVTLAALAREPTLEELEFAAKGWHIHLPKVRLSRAVGARARFERLATGLTFGGCMNLPWRHGLSPSRRRSPRPWPSPSASSTAS